MSRHLWALAAVSSLFLASCQKETQVERANREGILLVGNAAEPKALDHQLVTGVPESKIITAVFEGLVADDPTQDDGAPPGAAASWQHNEEMTEWVFHLQPEGKWSDGQRVTAEDFVFAYNRLLHPDFAGPYAEMLYFLENAEEYNKNRRAWIFLNKGAVEGVSWEKMKAIDFDKDVTVEIGDLGSAPKWEDLKNDDQRKRFAKSKGLDALPPVVLDWILGRVSDRYRWPSGVDLGHARRLLTVMRDRANDDLFVLSQVGVTADGPLTLRVKLREPVPYLPSLTRHYTWFPVPKHVVVKFGKMTDRFTKWSVLPNMVGNGPFKLTQWRFHDFIEVQRNPHYWDAAGVRLNGIRFYPIENQYTETRAFLSGQLHTTYQLPSDLIRTVKENAPQFLRQEPYVGTTFVRLNTKRPALSDPRVRQALSLTLNRKLLCEHIMEGYFPAPSLTPKMGTYEPEPKLTFDPEKARALLAEAGFPNGEGFPVYSMLISKPAARAGAEALQAMWAKHLNIRVNIQNMDWGSYISAQQSLNFDMASAGWIGDYLDPTTFLNMWTDGNGNNNTGWSHPNYEALLREAALKADPAERFRLFREAEALLMDAQPIIPISHYTRNYLLRPEVKGWQPLLLDNHPWAAIYLER
jgi:oligopeptide transport system substrate-binding protein